MTLAGLVFTVYNWARPRDLSHYESFEQYHATFYRHVEALSVTPFASRALDRGLSALLVALTRQGQLTWNPNASAQNVTLRDEDMAGIVDEIARRAGEVSGKPAVASLVREMVQARLDDWEAQQRKPAVQLTYRLESGGALGLRLVNDGRGARGFNRDGRGRGAHNRYIGRSGRGASVRPSSSIAYVRLASGRKSFAVAGGSAPPQMRPARLALAPELRSGPCTRPASRRCGRSSRRPASG